MSDNDLSFKKAKLQQPGWLAHWLEPDANNLCQAAEQWVNRHHHHDDDEVWTNQATECNGSNYNRNTEEHLIVDWILSQNSRVPHRGREKKGLGIFTVSFIVTNVATSSATTDYINFYYYVIQY